MKLIFLTSNKNKLREAQQILGNKIAIHSHSFPIQEIQSMSVEEVVHAKTLTAFDILQKPLFCEDTALYIDMGNGKYFPGPLIKHYMNALGSESFLKFHKNSSAHAITAIGYHDSKKLHIFTGRVEGKISNIQRGKIGFGWDPFFIPFAEQNKDNLTFAEMDSITKNSCSHRYIALTNLKKYILQKSPEKKL